MPKNRTYYTLLLICFWQLTIGSSCQTEKLSPELYVDYINSNDNGFVKVEQMNGVVFSLQYRPVDYDCIQQLGYDKLTSDLLDKCKQESSGVYQFVLRIGSEDHKSDPLTLHITSENEYYNRLSYYNGEDMKEDLLLIQGNDTMTCVFTHFERSFHMSQYNQVLISFQRKMGKENDKDDLVLLLNERIYNIGTIKFRFDIDDITKPEIKLEI